METKLVYVPLIGSALDFEWMSDDIDRLRLRLLSFYGEEGLERSFSGIQVLIIQRVEVLPLEIPAD